MTERITIQDGIARLEYIETRGEVPVSALEGIVKHTTPILIPAMPKGVLSAYIDDSAKKGAIIVRRNPARHKLNLHYDGTGHTPAADAGKEYRVYDLQLPYLYWVYYFNYDITTTIDGLNTFAISDSYLYMTPEPITDLDQNLYPAQLWNVRSGRICWGQTIPRKMSLADAIDTLTDEFPTTTFTPHYDHPVPPGVVDYADWEKKSSDPLCFTKWDWKAWPQGPNKARDRLTATSESLEQFTLQGDATVEIPPPPQPFTSALLREWLNNLPPYAQERFLLTAEHFNPTEVETPAQKPDTVQRTVNVPGVGDIVVTEQIA